MENFTRCQLEVDFLNMNEDAYSKLRTYVTRLNLIFDKEQNNFAGLCYYVYNLKKLFEEYKSSFLNRKVVVNGLYTFSCDLRTILDGFGIDKTQESRLLGCYEKFLNPLGNEKGKPFVKAEFQPFNKSKLFELLTVPLATLISDIDTGKLNALMTVKKIREYVKSVLPGKQNESIVSNNLDEADENIEAAYDSSKYYEFSYFEKKSKNQLLNIVWELQKSHQKLLNKENKSKNGKENTNKI